MLEFDLKRDEVTRRIAYYIIESIFKKQCYSKLPAPSVAGIEDPNVVVNISKLISLSPKDQKWLML
jgi:hypothetical protein